ncbi:MAG: hypothetical protein HY017_06310 [Betaproteobacteria bacterium]|nr:hypothetical protein [Betaproteobacteria bacterium]
MSIARHHNEWLSLLEVSAPFLSLPVLMRIFPQRLEVMYTVLYKVQDARGPASAENPARFFQHVGRT